MKLLWQPFKSSLQWIWLTVLCGARIMWAGWLSQTFNLFPYFVFHLVAKYVMRTKLYNLWLIHESYAISFCWTPSKWDLFLLDYQYKEHAFWLASPVYNSGIASIKMPLRPMNLNFGQTKSGYDTCLDWNLVFQAPILAQNGPYPIWHDSVRYCSCFVNSGCLI